MNEKETELKGSVVHVRFANDATKATEWMDLQVPRTALNMFSKPATVHWFYGQQTSGAQNLSEPERSLPIWERAALHYLRGIIDARIRELDSLLGE